MKPDRDEKGRFYKGFTPWIKGKTHSEKTRRLLSLKIKGVPHKNRDGWAFSAGYIEVMVADHPYAMRRGYVWEHRLVVESQLGHYLLPTDSVHHVDEDKLNNFPENLMAFTSESAHQRFHNNPQNVLPEEIIFDGRKLKPTPSTT